jgi:hypothetical protein
MKAITATTSTGSGVAASYSIMCKPLHCLVALPPLHPNPMAAAQVPGIGKVQEQTLTALGVSRCGQLLEQCGLLAALFSPVSQVGLCTCLHCHGLLQPCWCAPASYLGLCVRQCCRYVPHS